MREKLRFLGLDVHAETIAVAIAEPDGEVRSLGTIANREDSIRKFIKELGPAEQLRACYEAGPTGFVLQAGLCIGGNARLSFSSIDTAYQADPIRCFPEHWTTARPRRST
jgi:hypothetical protein